MTLKEGKWMDRKDLKGIQRQFNLSQTHTLKKLIQRAKMV